MAIDLNAIRKVFADWPSELDVARCETNWALTAQSFYCAASVLQQEASIVHQRMHFGEPFEVTEGVLIRTQISRPALFCMAFALELAAKAATIRKIQGKGIEHAKRLPFAGHYLCELCEQLPELTITADDKDLLVQAQQLVVSGKYPSDIMPRDDKPFSDLPQLTFFMEWAIPIYRQLMRIACEAPSSDQKCAPQAAHS